jgi:NAD(P)-dependent dehydrogenase (short-subunit alcohol dehydrogenase family)
VLLTDIDPGVLDEATEGLAAAGLSVAALICDVADPASAAEMADAANARWGRIDILVNNAAISDDTPIDDLTDERWRHVLAINLDSVLHCTRAALPFLRQSPCASIINIASVQGIRGQPHAMAYATAKGGVVNLTRCMAVDFGPEGIRANAVAPGYIDTRMALQKQDGTHEHQTEWYQDIYVKHGRMPLRRAGVPEDVAGPIVFLASDESRYITGQVLVVDGGFTCTY